MEELSKEKLSETLDAGKRVKEESAADIPAEEIEDNNRDVETDTETDTDEDSDSDSDYEFECDVCNKTFFDYLQLKQHQKGKKHAKAVLRKKKEKKLKKKDAATKSDDDPLVQELYAECKICKKEFGGPESYEQHLKCKKHKRKVLEVSILEKIREEGGKINPEKLTELKKKKQKSDDVSEVSKEKSASLTLEDLSEKNQEYECKECESLFSGLTPYVQHLTSKRHAKKIEKKNLLHKVVPETLEEVEISEKSKENDLNIVCLEDDVLVCKVCSTSFSGPENAVAHMKSKKHSKNWDKYIRKLKRKEEKKKSMKKDLSTSKENEMKPDDGSQSEKLQLTSDGFVKSDQSDSSNNHSIKPSTSSGNDDKNLAAYEKYKEYKAIMMSLSEDQMMK